MHAKFMRVFERPGTEIVILQDILVNRIVVICEKTKKEREME